MLSQHIPPTYYRCNSNNKNTVKDAGIRDFTLDKTTVFTQ